MYEYLGGIVVVIFLLWCVCGSFYCVYVLGEAKWEHFKSRKKVIFMLCCGVIAISVSFIIAIMEITIFFIIEIMEITIFPILVEYHKKINLWIKK